jgi:nitronate monooxygenase
VAVADAEAAKYRKAWAEGDPDGSNTIVGEAAGLIPGIVPARTIIERMVREAAERIAAAGARELGS